jgi:hypothetical protein
LTSAVAGVGTREFFSRLPQSAEVVGAGYDRRIRSGKPLRATAVWAHFLIELVMA